MSNVKVLPVVEGSIIWLHDIDFLDESTTDVAMSRLRTAVGHDRFVILTTTGSGIVDVLGPDELVERVRAALDDDAVVEATIQGPDRRPTNDWCRDLGIVIDDSGGWRQVNDLGVCLFETPISRAEFDVRLALSTFHLDRRDR